MASQNNSRNDSNNQSGQNSSQNNAQKNAQSASSRGTPGNEQAARSEEQLDREQKSLIGNTSEDRNLTGSTTYVTLPDQGPDKGQSSRKASGSQESGGSESYGSSRGDTQR
jgi:hypothetical protein